MYAILGTRKRAMAVVQWKVKCSDKLTWVFCSLECRLCILTNDIIILTTDVQYGQFISVATRSKMLFLVLLHFTSKSIFSCFSIWNRKWCLIQIVFLIERGRQNPQQTKLGNCFGRGQINRSCLLQNKTKTTKNDIYSYNSSIFIPLLHIKTQDKLKPH